jgi:hypothetical protein
MGRVGGIPTMNVCITTRCMSVKSSMLGAALALVLVL